LVPAQGFEPWTIGLKDRCSAKLSYAGVAVDYFGKNLGTNVERLRPAFFSGFVCGESRLVDHKLEVGLGRREAYSDRLG
jgi:hypothetical protein